MTALSPDPVTTPSSHRPALPWQPASAAVLRMAGYPFALLHALSDPECLRLARLRLAAREELDSFARQAETSRGEATNNADRSLLRALRRGRPYPPRDEPLSEPFARTARRHEEALRRRDDADHAYRQAYAAACLGGAERVLDLFRTTPSLQDMLLVSNDSAHARLVRWLHRADPRGTWSKQDRNNTATLVRYLQRVCAKNDTTSHFGPLAPARLDGSRTGVHWRPAPLRRHTVLSRWAVEAVAGALREAHEDVRLLDRPRRAPGARTEGGRLHLVRLDQRRMSTEVRETVHPAPPRDLTPALLELFDRCDGETTVARLAADIGREPREVAGDVAALRDLGAVAGEPDLAYGVEDALEALRDRLSVLGDGHPASRACARLARAVTALQSAPPDGRPQALSDLKSLFTDITGLPPHRPQRGFYSDHSLFHEHCTGVAGDLVLGEPLVSRMSGELSLLYDLFLLRPRWRLRLERELLADWFRHRFGPEARVPAGDYLTAFVTDLDRLADRYRDCETRVSAIAGELEDALLPPAGTTAHRHHVDRARVTALIDRYGLDEPAVCNPDLMIAAADRDHLEHGEPTLVVGDLHAMDDHLSHGSIAPFVEQAFPSFPSEEAELYARLLAPDETLADVTQCHLNKTFPRIAPTGPDIEAHDRSDAPGPDRLRLAELTVELADGRLRLLAPDGRRLRLTVPPLAWPMLRHNPFAPFGFPTTTETKAVGGAGRTHLPRISVGEVVLQRELWRVDPAEIAAAGVDEEPDAFARLQRLRARLELPRHVYVRCPGEPKPVYCDLDSPLLAGCLTRMAARAPEGGPLEISEMLPGPGQLWFGDQDGGRTCEVRYAVFTARAGDSTPAARPPTSKRTP